MSEIHSSSYFWLTVVKREEGKWVGGVETQGGSSGQVPWLYWKLLHDEEKHTKK